MKTLRLLLATAMVPVAMMGQVVESDLEDLNTLEEDLASVSSEEELIGDMGYSFAVEETPINTRFTEYATAFYNNQLVIVSSRKIGASGGKKNKLNDEPMARVFGLNIKGNGSLERPLLYPGLFNTRNNHGGLSFSSDQKMVFYTRALPEDPDRHDLYYATLSKTVRGLWENETLVDFNSDAYSIENPALSPDSKTLYFSSNMPGGYGGFDLYKVEIAEDGTLGTPVNLGGTINTSGNERFPNISPDGKNLYLSSDGHRGLGGYDIFRSAITANGFNSPENIGNTINSSYDDIAFVPSSNESGYFSSNRKNDSKSTDIYYFDGYIAK